MICGFWLGFDILLQRVKALNHYCHLSLQTYLYSWLGYAVATGGGYCLADLVKKILITIYSLLILKIMAW